jgi:hypothetical protein
MTKRALKKTTGSTVASTVASSNYKRVRHFNTINRLRECLPYNPYTDSMWYLRGELAKSIRQNDPDINDLDLGKLMGHIYPAPPIVDKYTGNFVDNICWDLDLFMQSANFWMVDDDDLPPSIYLAVISIHLKNPTKKLYIELKELYNRPVFASLFAEIREVDWRLPWTRLSNGYLDGLAKCGFTNILKNTKNLFPNTFVTINTITESIRYHHFSCFLYLVQLYTNWYGNQMNIDNFNKCVYASISSDNYDCLRYLVETYYTPNPSELSWNIVRTLCKAIHMDQPWIKEHSERFSERSDSVGYSGTPGVKSCPRQIMLCEERCSSGVKCIHYLYTMICAQNEHNTTYFWTSLSEALFIAVTDHRWYTTSPPIHRIKYLFEHVDHLHQKLEEVETNLNLKYNIRNKLLDNVFIGIQYQISLECLTYLHECQQWRWTDFAFKCMVKHNNFECVKYMHANCTYNGETKPSMNHETTFICVRVAIENQNEQMLVWLLENGTLDMTESRLPCLGVIAVANDNVECLKRVHEFGCPISEVAIKQALLRGHTNCLEYIVDHGYSVEPYINNNSRGTPVLHPLSGMLLYRKKIPLSKEILKPLSFMYTS